MSVVKFKPRQKPPIARKNRLALEAIDQALGAEFVRLAQLYGTYAVTTVAVGYIAKCIQTARRKRGGPEDKWVSRMSKILKDSVIGES